MERTNGTVNADVKERPDFIIVKKKRDAATGEWVEVESICCPALAQYIREHEHYRFIETPDPDVTINFWYKDGVYQEIGQRRMKSRIKARINAWNPDIMKMRDVNEVYQDLTTDDGQFYDVNADNPEELVVNFKNGLFYPMTNEFKPHTPDLFLTRQLPIDFPLDALECGFCLEDKIPTFRRYMTRFCYGANGKHPDGSTRWTCLCEWMAAILSNIHGVRFKKSMWVCGPQGGGKSQLPELMKYMLGNKNACSLDLKRLKSRSGEKFARQMRLVYLSDWNLLKFVGRGNVICVERETIKREWLERFISYFDGFLWLCMDTMPKLAGNKEIDVDDRIMVFKSPDAIPESERDKALLEKLKSEAPYIAAYLLSYLPAVVERGFGYELTEPLNAQKKYAFENNPVRQWLAECCIDVQNPADDTESGTVERWRKADKKPTWDRLHKVYCAWCSEHENTYMLKRSALKRELKAIAGKADMLDVPDPEHPEKPAFFFPRRKTGMVVSRWCLNEYALSYYQAYL